jgi:hypothetical protein
MEDIKEIVFPVLTVKKDEVVEPAECESLLRNCSRLALEENYHIGLLIFDSAGQRFEVKSVKVLSEPYSFPIMIPKGFASASEYFLELELTEPVPFEFEALKELLLKHTSLEGYASEAAQTTNFAELYHLVDSLYPHCL